MRRDAGGVSEQRDLFKPGLSIGAVARHVTEAPERFAERLKRLRPRDVRGPVGGHRVAGPPPAVLRSRSPGDAVVAIVRWARKRVGVFFFKQKTAYEI